MLNVAILGAGIGAQHMDGYLALPERFNVVTICDLDIARASSLADMAKGCTVTSEIAEVLSDPRVDIIDICLPPHLHAPVAKNALSAGKHVICEKPFACSVLEAEDILAAASASQCKIMPIFQYRYGRGLRQLTGLQERALTGKPLVATVETHWDRDADYYSVAWRGRWKSERGGAVLGHAIHIHDLVTRYFGAATEVSVMLDTRVNPIETEDCAAIAMRTASGGLVTSSVTLGGAGNMSRMRLVFDALTAESGRNPYAPGSDDWTFVSRKTEGQSAIDKALSEISREMDGQPSGFAGQFLAVSDHLGGKPADMVTPEDGLRSIELVAAIYQAARTGARVSLPLDRSLPICADWIPVQFRGDQSDA
ncbi:MAG: Gfo/Idh/MocA family oxidoreductase [Alphaproteobacteria bacterium]|nr:Gfo/Idh/MocA family oxidoreductase [Alphaproteobacteria bacterium]